MDRYSLEEIALLGSLILARPLNERHLVFIPVDSYPLIELELKQTPAEIERHLRKSLRKTGLKIPSASLELRDYSYENGRLEEIFEVLKAHPPLLMRGIERLLTSEELSHLLYMEEATTATYVGIEAATRHLRQELIRLVGDVPTFNDLYYFADKVGHLYGHFRMGPTLSEFYEHRIMVLHPESRFGVFEYAPIAVDDCFDSRESCIVLLNIAIDVSRMKTMEHLEEYMDRAASNREEEYRKATQKDLAYLRGTSR